MWCGMVLDYGIILRVKKISVESSAKMMKLMSSEYMRGKKQKGKVMKNMSVT